jgi:hypothetical protein
LRLPELNKCFCLLRSRPLAVHVVAANCRTLVPSPRKPGGTAFLMSFTRAGEPLCARSKPTAAIPPSRKTGTNSRSARTASSISASIAALLAYSCLETSSCKSPREQRQLILSGQPGLTGKQAQTPGFAGTMVAHPVGRQRQGCIWLRAL